MKFLPSVVRAEHRDGFRIHNVFNDGSENIFALISVVIAASSGLPIFPHDAETKVSPINRTQSVTMRGRQILLKEWRFIVASDTGSLRASEEVGERHVLHSPKTQREKQTTAGRVLARIDSTPVGRLLSMLFKAGYPDRSPREYVPGILEPSVTLKNTRLETKRREARNQPPVSNAVRFGYA